ncbi:MAG TPA: hypothetical protein VHJ38_04785 [Nitrososphaeraceae archaeon]|nr:hypothetical protein [Nitrososphaeraceae archaeon]
MLGIYISFLKNENMFVEKNFIHSLVDKYGRHTVYSEMVEDGIPEACNFLHLKHRLHSPLEKSLIERE